MTFPRRGRTRRVMKPPSKDAAGGREAADREAKLAQALRANLRRRKAVKAGDRAASPAREPDKRS